MDKRRKECPDSGWSWVVAFAGCFSNIILGGLYRLVGYILVALVHEFNVTREQASWPIVTFFVVSKVVGIVTGPLAHRFGIRIISILGSLLGAAGLAGCYVFTSLDAITFFFGVVFGLGIGPVFLLIPVIVNQYFKKHRATGMGIALCGPGFGSFILPVLHEYFLYNYGLSGYFLLLSGTVLQVVIPSALMRTPAWIKKKKNATKSKLTTNNSVEIVKPDVRCIYKNASASTSDTTVDETDSLTGNAKQELERVVSESNCLEKDSQERSLGILEIFRAVLLSPMFHVVTTGYGGFLASRIMYNVTIIDYMIDTSVDEEDTKYVLFIFGISDLIGRLGFGWITDRKYLQRRHYVMICSVAIAFVFFSYPFVYGYGMHLCISFIYGLLQGCVFIIYPVLMMDYLGSEMQSIAMGCMNFFHGLGILLCPLVIGYFRDNLGSYSCMYFLLSAMSLATAIMWLCESCFVKGQIQAENNEPEKKENQ